MKSFEKYFVFTIFVFVSLLLFMVVNITIIPSLQYSYFKTELKKSQKQSLSEVPEKEMQKLKQTAVSLNKKLERLTPGNVFLVINTTENTFTLYKNNQVVRKGMCSTGSFIELEVDSTKSYTFETPKGILTVKNKITNPVWRKPDWAFIEEGLPVPSANSSTRYERNVLGDYALSLGNGYLIHGTLYQRFLGMPVTHGCVRLGDDDLEFVYNSMPVGAKVFIY